MTPQPPKHGPDANPEPDPDDPLDRLVSGAQASADGSFDAWDVDAAWNSTRERMEVPVSRPGREPRVLPWPQRRPNRRIPVWASGTRPLLRAAGIFFVVAAGVATAYFGRSPKLDPQRQRLAGAVPVREYATSRGERLNIELVDGTRIVLGPTSRLRVPADYGRAAGDTVGWTSQSSHGPRALALEGEGHFTVVHDSTRPFSVRAGPALVRDIGTTFVVRAFGERHPVDVVVTEGAVLLADTRLDRGDLGRMELAGNVSVRRRVNVLPYTAWTQGRLVFDNTPLAEALPTLERWYDLRIVANPSQASRRLYATLMEGDPPSKVIDLIAVSLDLIPERNGRHVTLHPRSK